MHDRSIDLCRHVVYIDVYITVSLSYHGSNLFLSCFHLRNSPDNYVCICCFSKPTPSQKIQFRKLAKNIECPRNLNLNLRKITTMTTKAKLKATLSSASKSQLPPPKPQNKNKKTRAVALPQPSIDEEDSEVVQEEEKQKGDFDDNSGDEEEDEDEEGTDSDYDGVDQEGMERLVKLLGEDGLDDFDRAQLRGMTGEEDEGEAEDESDNEEEQEGSGDEEKEEDISDEDEEHDISLVKPTTNSSPSPDEEQEDEEEDHDEIPLDEVESIIDEDTVPKQKLEIDNQVRMPHLRSISLLNFNKHYH